MAGIRSWPVFSASSSFASVVMAANVSISILPSGERQCCQTPPRAKGSSSFIANAQGSFVLGAILLSSRRAALPPTAPLGTGRESFQLTRLKPS
jgi:hypothetical protein